MSQSSRVWFVTGVSAGFGRLLAEEVLRRGERVIATARNITAIDDLAQQYPETARALPLDVTKPEQIALIAEQAIASFGQVDVLVNNAGYGLFGAIEEADEAEFEPVFQTNIYGLIRTTRAFLPHFRERRSGRILNLSSIGGLIGGPGFGYYNTTKFAVEGFSEALAGELKPLGVYVTLIEPGPFRTEFLGRSGKVAERAIADYAETAGKARTYATANHGKQAGDPQRAVEIMIDIADAPNPPVHLLLGKAALTRMRNRLTQWNDNLQGWEAVTLSADYPEGE